MERQSTSSEGTTEPAVFVVANDVVPGLGVTVAAPGLRCHGLTQGLQANGIRATAVLPTGQLRRRWRADVPAPGSAEVLTIADDRLGEFLESRAPAVVVLTNSNQIDRVPDRDDIAVIFDLFAPRSLEVAFQSERYPTKETAEIRRRNHEILRRCRGVIINGEKKIGYYLGWLMQVERDPRSVPVDVVPMAMPAGFDGSYGSGLEAPQLVTAGYLQGWSRPGPWFNAIADAAAEAGGTMHVAVSRRRADGDGIDPNERITAFDHPAVNQHGAMDFDAYQAFLRRMDVAVDLFDRTHERELAMVTRTVGAISCGLPVVHPPWTETGALIGRYDAGWLVDPADADTLRRTLGTVVADADERRAKAANARRLWAEVFAPDVAARPLAAQVRELAPKLTKTPIAVVGQ